MLNSVYHYTSDFQQEIKAEYAKSLNKLGELCELDRIHRYNLSYLECLAAKYGMDIPLKVVNEIRAEHIESEKLQSEIIRMENILKESDSAKKIREYELTVVREQLKTKNAQAEIHKKNITYLENLLLKHKEDVPLSLHNAIQEEAGHFLLVRRTIAKLDWHLQEMTGNPPLFMDWYIESEQKRFTLHSEPVREDNHDVLIHTVYQKEDKGVAFGSHILRVLGECAFNQDVLCIVKWRLKICIVASNGTSGPVLGFLSAITNKNGRMPELLARPYDTNSFFERLGVILVRQGMRYYTISTEWKKFDFEFNPHSDIVYFFTDQRTMGGSFSLWMWRRRERRKHNRILQYLPYILDRVHEEMLREKH